MSNATCSVGGCPKPVLALTWCSMHYNRWRKYGSLDAPASKTPWERFWAKVEVDRKAGCWLFTGAPSGAAGYCQFRPGGLQPKVYAHRWSYEYLIGPIPEGFQLDHLCRVTNCVNPAHLEPVTPQVNNARAKQTITQCPHGHDYTPGNTYEDPRGWRACLTCRRERSREWGRKHRTAA